jgi:hypothetical protein
MSTIQEINSAIMFGNLTNDQLNSVVAAIKYRRSQLAKSVKLSIAPGSKVSFYARHQSRDIVGIVEKIAIKYVTVNANGQRWRVPANMVEAV